MKSSVSVAKDQLPVSKIGFLTGKQQAGRVKIFIKILGL
jgi:hypothetical protein